MNIRKNRDRTCNKRRIFKAIWNYKETAGIGGGGAIHEERMLHELNTHRAREGKRNEGNQHVTSWSK